MLGLPGKAEVDEMTHKVRQKLPLYGHLMKERDMIVSWRFLVILNEEAG